MIHSLDLNGTWKLRPCDGHRGRPEYAVREQTDWTKYIDAQVPGEVHLDAQRAGWIPDPYTGTNALQARWIEEHIWAYRREFVAPAEALNGRAWLAFDQLDYAASIYLNGVEVGKHHNVFYPCRVDVTGKLREGSNWITVVVESGLHETADKQGAGYLMSHDKFMPKRHWLRKPQCQFSWDWSIRFVNVGITKGVRLEYTSTPARADQLVPLITLAPDFKSASIRVRQFVEGLGKENVKGTLLAELVETGEKVTADVEIKPRLNPVEAALAVQNPKLWWPVGHGPQNLYTLRVTLTIGGKVISTKTKRIGFRQVRIDQQPHPQGGQFFIFEINGRRIFCKGGNFVPADMIFCRIDRARYDKLTDLALESNFNFLRVWGGGLYEADDFYELCDEKGILVWQEFIFACGRYPAQDLEWLNNFRAEATWNIRRLASHPSLVIWCGNNEMECGTWGWGFDNSGVPMPDYGIFHYVLPRMMQAEDPTRAYWPSSPYSPPNSNLGTVGPWDDRVGDQHPWSIGFVDTDFRKYRGMLCRFPNEGGFLGSTSLPTIKKCMEGGPFVINNLAWQLHDNGVDSFAEPSPPNEMLMFHLGKNIHEMSMEDYCYWAAIVQAEALREYTDNFHRRMFDSSSAIFWMYNDTWPVVRSWTTVDYSLRKTPSFHPVRRAMAPVNVVLAEENDQVVVFGINETNEVIKADLRYGVFNLAGGFVLDTTIAAALAPNASTRIASFPKSQWPQPNQQAAFVMLSQNGKLLARNRLLLPLLKEMQWPKAQVKVTLRNGQAIFESPTFALSVCLDLDGDPALADNLFDLYPGIPYAINWKSAEQPKIIRIGNLA